MTRKVGQMKVQHNFSYLVSFRQQTYIFCNTFNAINGGDLNYELHFSTYVYALNCQIVREACTILSMGLHTMEATLSSMTLKVLSLVQRKKLRLFKTSLRSNLPKKN